MNMFYCDYFVIIIKAASQALENDFLRLYFVEVLEILKLKILNTEYSNKLPITSPYTSTKLQR